MPEEIGPVGGPGSFQRRLSSVLRDRGVSVVFGLENCPPDGVILIIGGTRRLGMLQACKSRGIPIVHRLDGLNWRHRIGPFRPVPWLRAGVRNWILRTIRNRFANHVVYQSDFARGWWERRFGSAPCRTSTIRNAVDLNVFKRGPDVKINESPVLISAEANVETDPVTERIISDVCGILKDKKAIRELRLCGNVSQSTRDALSGTPGVVFAGHIPNDKMPSAYANADLFLSIEVCPACPNAVIEALASGLPVVSFDTGAVKELVPGDAGIVVPYGADPWKLQVPDTRSLADAVTSVLQKLQEYSNAARRAAESRFDIENMADSYVSLFEEITRR